jgi:uncharacterized protein (DUF488 family)
LKSARIRRVLDIRLRNSSQLAGFTKARDLPFLLRELCGAEYLHLPLLAPTEEMLKAYGGRKRNWPAYEQAFRRLLVERKVHEALDRSLFLEPAVLLCSEPKPDRCHRRLVAEYLSEKWPGVEVRHL